jgi:ribonuclease BN (tRNA processing enzyme)
MEVIILGTGVCIPTQERNPSGIFVHVGNTTLLLDSGSGTLSRLTKIGVDYRMLTALCYTHTHADHIIDLVPILQAITIAPLIARTTPLMLLGPIGFHTFLSHLAQAFGSWILKPERMQEIHEMEYGVMELGSCNIRTAPMQHDDAAIGYRIELPEGLVLTYSGDTDYCREIVALANNSDVLILECSTPDDQKCAGHLTPSLAAQIAAEANAKTLVLTHFYPECDDVEIESICRRTFHGDIYRAHDLMRIEI